MWNYRRSLLKTLHFTLNLVTSSSEDVRLPGQILVAITKKCCTSFEVCDVFSWKSKHMFMTTKTKKITNCKEGRSFFVVLSSSNFWLRRTGVMPFHISPGLDEWHNNHVKVLYVNYFTNLRLKEIHGYLAGPLYQFTSDCKAPSRLKGILFPIYPSFLMRKYILVSLTVRVEASIHKGKSLSRICVNEKYVVYCSVSRWLDKIHFPWKSLRDYDFNFSEKCFDLWDAFQRKPKIMRGILNFQFCCSVFQICLFIEQLEGWCVSWLNLSLKCVKINTKEENPIQRKAGKTTLF